VFTIKERGLPRVGILGNPSDGYGGRVLAATFEDFCAHVELSESELFRFLPDDPEGLEALSWPELCGELKPRERQGVFSLVAAATHVFAGTVHRPAEPFTLRVRTDIPRQAGLSGSSAIIIAVLRALLRHTQHALHPLEVARWALLAETEVLKIAAGPQDRVVQAFEGLLDMDFAPEHGFCRPTPLPTSLLPPMFLAWNPQTGEPSGQTHRPLRQRFMEGDLVVVNAMHRLRMLVERGVVALKQGDMEDFRFCINANFDIRASMLTIGRDDARMVALGREHGAAVKFCGSGGAVLVAPKSLTDEERLRGVYTEAGFRFCRLHMKDAAHP
jgi:glucuronokinase